MTTTANRRVRALIVDDEALARQRLAGMLAEIDGIDVIAQADGGSAAVEAIVNLTPELVFLDVQMPGLDGFGVLRCTAGSHRPAVVFVTAHDDYAIRAFDVQAVDYLLKPITGARLREAVRRAVERLESGAREGSTRAIESVLQSAHETPAAVARIPLKLAEGTIFVSAAQIDWIESDGPHLRVHMTDKGRSAFHTLRETMNEFEARVTAFRFLRVHRSAIVNVDAVQAVLPIAKGDYHLVLRDSTRVRSGRSYRESVQALIR